MKRAVWMSVKLGAVAAAAILAGCVSQGKYDEVKFAERNCNAAREQLQADLAGAQNTIRTKDDEINRLKGLLANREDLIKDMRERLGISGKALTDMTKVYKDLVGKWTPGTPLQSPLPPRVNEALENFARKYSKYVEYDPARGVLKFKSDLLFDVGSYQVKGEVTGLLQEFAKILEIPEAAAFDCVVVGHTDTIPISKPSTREKTPTNWHLSAYRAISVMDILRDAGVSSNRLGVMGYGEFRPVAPNNGRKGNAKNRRVEIYIVPKQAVGERASTVAETKTEAAPAAPTTEEPAVSEEDTSGAGGEETPPIEK
jgi:chemotaxis protein MotB